MRIKLLFTILLALVSYSEETIFCIATASMTEKEGYSSMVYEVTNNKGEKVIINVYVKDPAEITEKDVEKTSIDSSREGVINILLSEEGGEKMQRLTSKMNLGHDQLATIIEGKLVFYATVQSTLARNFQVSGLNNYTQLELQELAKKIDSSAKSK